MHVRGPVHQLSLTCIAQRKPNKCAHAATLYDDSGWIQAPLWTKDGKALIYVKDSKLSVSRVHSSLE